MNYPDDWTEEDIEQCSYCSMCDKPFKDGDEEWWSHCGNLVCSEECKNEYEAG